MSVSVSCGPAGLDLNASLEPGWVMLAAAGSVKRPVEAPWFRVSPSSVCGVHSSFSGPESLCRSNLKCDCCVSSCQPHSRITTCSCNTTADPLLAERHFICPWFWARRWFYSGGSEVKEMSSRLWEHKHLKLRCLVLTRLEVADAGVRVTQRGQDEASLPWKHPDSSLSTIHTCTVRDRLKLLPGVLNWIRHLIIRFK